MATSRGKSKSSQSERGIPLAEYLRRRPRRKAIIVGVVVCFLVLLSVADHFGWFGAWMETPTIYEGRDFRLVRVISAELLEVVSVDSADVPMRVRLLGIRASANATLDTEARLFIEKQCGGGPIRLKIQVATLRDEANRLLAYIQLPDGSLLNEQLLLAGLAQVRDEQPHLEHQRFTLMQLQAQRTKTGVWAADQ